MNRRRNLLLLVAVIFIFAGVRVCLAATITVNWDGSADYTTIQPAINAASNGDEIIVADGTYTGDGNRDIGFLGKAITVKSQNGPDNCIIDCQGPQEDPHRAFIFQNSEDPGSVLDGFTITNGCTTHGGGTRIYKSDPVIRNCVFKENSAVYDGGGAVDNYCGSPVIENCVFIQNKAFHEASILPIGGAVWNVAGSPRITNCIFIDNLSKSSGGAIYNGTGMSMISYNDYDPDDTLKIENCVFSGNNASAFGGAIYNDVIDFIEPVLTQPAKLDVVNSTFIGNLANETGGLWCSDYWPREVRLTNSIFWANLDAEGMGESAQIYGNGSEEINYSCVQGWTGDLGGQGNIGEDPLFVAPGSWDDNGTPEDYTDDTWIEGDYHLRKVSPCVDAGDPNYIPAEDELDIDGEPRVMAGRIDMGADEVYVGKTITVALDGSGDYTTIQEAIDAANDRDTVIVDTGTYFENVNFGGKVIILTSTNPEDSYIVDTTIIDGGGLGTVVTFEGTEDPNCVLSGFTITGGYNDRGGGIYGGSHTKATIKNCVITGNEAGGSGYPHHEYDIGGGLSCCSGIIENCIITHNKAGVGGGLFGAYDITIKNCVFRNNEAVIIGGGVWIRSLSSESEISSSIFTNNVAGQGGGLFSDFGGGLIKDCLFKENIAKGFVTTYFAPALGGGAYLGGSWDESPKIQRCKFIDNMACASIDFYPYSGGGGLVLGDVNYDEILTKVEVSDCEFVGNTAVHENPPYKDSYGGGLLCFCFDALIRNCTFQGNKSDHGGGIGFGPYGSWRSTIQNCTISGNRARIAGGGISSSGGEYDWVELTDSISWGNQPNELNIEDLSLYANYCDIQGGWEGIEILDEGPLFVSTGYWDPNDTPENPDDDFWFDGDYHLRWTSPCINAGDPNYIPAEDEVDIDGEPRIMAGRIDMGADEVGPKQADFNRDGIINADDFSVLSNSWQTAPVDANWYILSDLWQDEVIDITDLAVFVDDWMWIADWH